MTDQWVEMWDDRYSQEGYAYGIHPNEYLREQLPKLEIGKILFAAEGEGRNAVYAANLGWKVSAFDISVEGRRKALQLAEKYSVDISYQVGELPTLHYEKYEFDAIALIYAHFPPQIRSEYHRLLDQYLKRGGIIILEAFGKKHLTYRLQNENVGGPGKLDFLLSTQELVSDFENYEKIELIEKEIEIKEGTYHNGRGSVVRFIGKKR